MQIVSVTLPATLAQELAIWGKQTAKLFGAISRIQQASLVQEERWQQMEREADTDIAAGRITHFADITEALQSLDL